MLKDLCFEIIEKCPNECKFCSSNSCFSKDKIISFDDFKRVIDYFVSIGGISELSLSGGEPFLHPDIFNMISYSKSLGIMTVVFTSGIKKNNITSDLILYYTDEMNSKLKEIEENEPWNERLKENIRNYYMNFIDSPMLSCISKEEMYKLKELGLDKVVFDYQGYEYETDHFLMGRNQELRCCLLDSILNASYVGLDVDVHFVPMKPNYKEIGDILEMLEIAGVKNISILNFVPQGRGRINKDKLMLSMDELNEFMNVLNSCRDNYSGNIRIGIPLLDNNTHMCNAGLEKLDIKFDGTVLPCPAFKETSFDVMKKYGIKYYNIYENLEDIKIHGGKRKEPLCKKIYFDSLK